MADDDAPSDEVNEPRPSAPSPGPKPGTPHLVVRIVLGTAGLLLVVGFFLPWMQIDREMRSGLELVIETDPDVRDMVNETQRWVLLVIPALGAALTAVGFLGFRWSGAVSTGVGFVLMAYGIVTAVMLFFQRTGVGLWIIVGAAFLALGAGMATMLRARSAKSSPDVTLPDE